MPGLWAMVAALPCPGRVSWNFGTFRSDDHALGASQSWSFIPPAARIATGYMAAISWSAGGIIRITSQYAVAGPGGRATIPMRSLLRIHAGLPGLAPRISPTVSPLFLRSYGLSPHIGPDVACLYAGKPLALALVAACSRDRGTGELKSGGLSGRAGLLSSSSCSYLLRDPTRWAGAFDRLGAARFSTHPGLIFSST
jgi:hypothetical protein